jgi:serine/threonine-protein kinase
LTGLYAFLTDVSAQLIPRAVNIVRGFNAMKPNELGPLRDISCFDKLPEHHDTVSAEALPIWPGQLFDNRFLIIEVISRSGMACIFKAQDILRGNQFVAVKLPHLEYECDPTFFDRFHREERIGLELNHPFILKFVKVEEKCRPYIVTEFLSGCTLAHLLQAMRPLPEKDALKIASLICDALQYMHDRGVIHRDLKPQNIMLCKDGAIRIMDFGIARDAGSRRITRMGNSQSMGTPDYMAPEQVRGKRADHRTDIYNLGALLYEMLTGSVPFQDENQWAALNARTTGDPRAPRKLNRDISPQAEEIVLRALQRNPAERYPSAAAMKAQLDSSENVRVSGLSERLQQLPPPRRGLFRWPWTFATLLLGPPLIGILILCVLLLRQR